MTPRERFTAIRELSGLAIADLSEAAGVPMGSLEAIEAGTRDLDDLTIDETLAICSAMGVGPDFLLGRALIRA